MDPNGVVAEADDVSSRQARAASAAVAAIAIAAGAAAVAGIPRGFGGGAWATLAALGGAAAVADLAAGRPRRPSSLRASTPFLLAGAILLPAALLVVLAALHCVPWCVRDRCSRLAQTLTICTLTLPAVLAGAAVAAFARAQDAIGVDAAQALGALAACVAYVAADRSLAAAVLGLERERPGGAAEPFSREAVSTALLVAAAGVALAFFWRSNPWLIPVALAPLLVVGRLESLPALRDASRVDAKTGLFNVRHFDVVLAEELARSARFDRPLSLLMADLDHLRDINNAHGHLAGDAVLTGVAAIIREQLRQYDAAARFGGEEFSILLPETGPEQALEIAERIRRAVAGHRFEVDTVAGPVRATISIGVAAFPGDASDANGLIHRADVAAYRAKVAGRNRVLRAEPASTA